MKGKQTYRARSGRSGHFQRWTPRGTVIALPVRTSFKKKKASPNNTYMRRQVLCTEHRKQRRFGVIRSSQELNLWLWSKILSFDFYYIIWLIVYVILWQIQYLVKLPWMNVKSIKCEKTQKPSSQKRCFVFPTVPNPKKFNLQRRKSQAGSVEAEVFFVFWPFYSPNVGGKWGDRDGEQHVKNVPTQNQHRDTFDI